MTWTLLRKELRQHWLGFVTVLLVGGSCLSLIVVASISRDKSETPFEAFRLFTIVMSLLGALVLNHRLVVLEYQGRTQLFLEGLPVARWRMVAVKYALGLATLLLMLGAGFVVTILLAWRNQGVDLTHAGLMAARAVSAAWCMHSFCFLMGLSGRYRIAIYLSLLIVVSIVADQKGLELQRYGPVGLLDSQLAYERESPPWEALKQTWILIGVFTLLAAGLSLLREGSVAALLAERMSHKEKVLVAALLCGLLFTVGTLSDRNKKDPFDLKEAASVSTVGVTAKVASGRGEDDPVSRRLAGVVAGELGALREYLGIDELPPVFLVLRNDLDPNRYELGELAHKEGVHVRANFTSPQWQDRDFIAWLVPEVLVVSSRGRAKLETRRWVLDGFGHYWAARDRVGDDLPAVPALALRALYGTDGGFGELDLNRWLRFRDRVGSGVAGGVAWSGLQALARRKGPDSCRQFVQAVLGTVEPSDARATLRSRPWQVHLQTTTGLTREEFLRFWMDEIGAARQTLGKQLSVIPRLAGQATFLPLEEDARQVRFVLTVIPPPRDADRFTLEYKRIGAFDEEEKEESLQRESGFYHQGREIELPETFLRRQRVYWSFSMDVPAMGCAVVSGFEREEVP